MIVVIGTLIGRRVGDEVAADGLAARIALESAAAGASLELIAKVGNDATGDAVLRALTQGGVGHVATLRDPSRLTPILPSADEPTDAGVDEADPRPDGSMPPDEASALVLERADVSLGLRYLADFRVVVAIHAGSDVLAEVVAAAGWADTQLIVLVEPGSDAPASLPRNALVLAASSDDVDGVAREIGRYAAAVDRGEEPAVAYAALTASDRS